MAWGYSEQRDSTGRLTIEVSDNSPWALAVGTAVLALEGFGYEHIPTRVAIGLMVLTLLIFPAIYVVTRKSMRVLITPVSRSIVLRVDGRTRVVPFADVRYAVLDTKEERAINGETWEVRRVNLALAGGKVLPLNDKHGDFKAAHCDKLIAAINAAIAAP